MHALFYIREIPDYHLKGRDFMNIFKESGDFIGHNNLESEEDSFYSFFCLAEQVRSKMGGQGYLLDYYISAIFAALRETYAHEAAEEGFSAMSPYQSLCVSILEGGEKDKNNPLYSKTLTAAIAFIKDKAYHERITKLNLLCTTMADDYFNHSVDNYIAKQECILNQAIDLIQLREAYEQIIHIVGEPIMETLELKLKQRFLVSPLVSIYTQGFINDFLDRLTTRDIETNKQIFQLILDRISANKNQG